MIVDTDKLPPMQSLMLEVLAARYRFGEQIWTFESRLKRYAQALENLGLVGWKSGIVEKTILVWLTNDGKSSVLSDTYIPPTDRN